MLSNPNSSSSAVTTLFASASSPASGSARRSGDPAGLRSLTISAAVIALKALTTRDSGLVAVQLVDVSVALGIVVAGVEHEFVPQLGDGYIH
jgi:hypothetical protein